MEIEYSELGKFRGKDLMLVSREGDRITRLYGEIRKNRGKYFFKFDEGCREIQQNDAIWELGECPEYRGDVKNNLIIGKPQK